MPGLEDAIKERAGDRMKRVGDIAAGLLLMANRHDIDEFIAALKMAELTLVLNWDVERER